MSSSVLSLIHSCFFVQGVWTKEEDALLESYVARHGTSWAIISQAIGHRSADRTYIAPKAL